MRRLIACFCLSLLCAALHAADQRPAVVKAAPPIFPPWLRGPELSEGEVMISFVVTKEGKTTDVTATKSPHPLLSQAAISAVKQWTFRPGRKDGVPVAMRMMVPVVFLLEGFLGEKFLSGEFTCLNAAEGRELPPLIGHASPVYPGKHWRGNVEGTVTAEFTITAEGKTSDLKILSASHPEFAESVTKFVASFRFAMDPTYVGNPRVALDLKFISPGTLAKMPPVKPKKSGFEN